MGPGHVLAEVGQRAKDLSDDLAERLGSHRQPSISISRSRRLGAKNQLFQRRTILKPLISSTTLIFPWSGKVLVEGSDDDRGSDLEHQMRPSR